LAYGSNSANAAFSGLIDQIGGLYLGRLNYTTDQCKYNSHTGVGAGLVQKSDT